MNKYNKKMINILIAGDFCPKDRVEVLIDGSDYENLFSEIKPLFHKADYSIVNLEAPIVDDSKAFPIKKNGPSLKCSTKTIEALKYIEIGCTTLANNHFRDYGDIGVTNTISLIESSCIDYVGAGKNSEEANRILYKDINGYKIAIINCCEHEFSIAEKDRAGCNPLNPIQQYYSIKKAKDNSDFVIVIIHGGMELFQLPSPRMVETYRFFIDAGADTVVNHHQHCFSGYEIYRNKPIFYGLGNFCFDWNGKRDSMWNYGYMINLFLEKDKNIEYEIIPYAQCNKEPKIILKKNKEANEIKQQIQTLNKIISHDEMLKCHYEKYLNETSKSYDIINIWGNRYLKALYSRGYLPSLVSKTILRKVFNSINCESHRDRFLHFLKKKIEEY